ncbi:MAG: hypothetical protein ACD_2C00049G0005 [uncultured bacterium (gcode 4)]|uniref:Uncharacterized protein n=1 Tax=uncultured bacterium (gcode 4) TaxID=1234023 RepID=K2G6X2_9BACT|nr:MAG: hypothetical protein ACD_2C00049G0005 [uncultured bacterium (gcode 4)]
MKTLNLKKIIWLLIITILSLPIISYAEFWKLTPSQREIVQRRVDSTDLSVRRSYIQTVVSRIDSLIAVIQVSNMDESTIFRKVSILEDLRNLLLTRLQETATGTWLSNTWSINISNLATTSSLWGFSFNSSRAWTWYYVILPAGAIAPSSAQVKSWVDYIWNPASFKWTLNFSSWANNFNVSWLSQNSSYSLYFVTEDQNWILSTAAQNLNFNASGSTSGSNPPTYTVSLGNLTGNGWTLSVNSSWVWKWYYVVLPSWSQMPSSAQIRSWTDISWAASAFSWSFNLASWANSFNITWLNPNTNYVIYFVAENNNWNLNLFPASQTFFTTSMSNTWADSAPPTIAASVNYVTSNTVTVSMTSNESWTGYYVALPSGSGSLTSNQVKSWTSGTWTVIPSRWSFNISPWTNSFNVIALSPGTSYTIYVVAEDAYWNLLLTPQAISATTSSY